MLAIIATILGLSLAFSSMLLSWYILMPRKKKTQPGHNPELPTYGPDVGGRRGRAPTADGWGGLKTQKREMT